MTARPRSQRARTAALVLGLCTALSACSIGGGEKRPDKTKTSSPSTSDHVKPSHADVKDGIQGVVGPQLHRREGGSFGDNHVTVRKSSDTVFSTYAEIVYPAGSASKRAAAEDGEANAGGAQSYWSFKNGPVDSAYLRYWVRFPANFNWVKGGKLPGLFGGDVTSGRHIPDGTDGFSTRYMWRAQGAGEVYAYLPTSSEHGTSLGRGSWTWPTGRWACVEQHVVLNTPGRSDGSIQVWLDDQQVLDSQSLAFRSTTKLKIDGLFFSTFFGGGDSSWATPDDQRVRFGGFRISREKSGCS